MSVWAKFRFAVAGLAIMAATGCSEEKTASEAPVRPVKVVEIKAPQSGHSMTYSGSVRARTEVPSGFRVDGKITERLADVGQRVKPGDVLARIDATDYQLSVKQAEAELASAQKQVEIAALALKRAETLQQQNVTSQSSLEQAQLSAQQAVATRDAALSSLQQAQNRVEYTVLKAEAPGIVTAVSAEAGQVVSAGTPVVTLAEDGEKEAVIAVPEGEIAQFTPGQEVEAGFWFDRQLTLKGRVREVAGSADQQSRTFSIRVSLPDNPQIRLGMTATVTVSAKAQDASFVLPLAALDKRDGKTVVWLVDPASKKVSARAVTVEGFAPEGVRIRDGLAAGDLVVAAGTQFMQPDMPVLLDEARQADAAPSRPASNS